MLSIFSILAKVIKILGTEIVETINECPICYTSSCDMITSCNHQFCRSCFKSYVEKQNDSMENLPCPYCRTTGLTYKNIKINEEK